MQELRFRVGGPGAVQIGCWVLPRKPASNPPRGAPQDGVGGVYVMGSGNGRDAAQSFQWRPLGVRSLNTSEGEAAPLLWRVAGAPRTTPRRPQLGAKRLCHTRR